MGAPQRVLDLSTTPNPGIIATFSVEVEAGRIFQGGESQTAKGPGC